MNEPKEHTMTYAPHIHAADTAVELDRRENDGIEVSLRWDPSCDRLTVAVVDGRRGERFEVETSRDRALDVFHHPYAYAAHLRIEPVSTSAPQPTSAEIERAVEQLVASL